MRLRATGTIAPEGQAIDAEEIRRWVSLICDPSAGVQVQGLPSGRWKVLHGDDPGGIVSVCEQWNADCAGIYLSANPCQRDRSEPIRVESILRRRWLFLDIDPVRPKDANATDEERTEARAVTLEMRDYLTALGWPEPVYAGSGNGYYLLYRIDLEADQVSQSLLRTVTVRLADRFDTDAAKVDRKTHNANRILKVCGTWARKGPQTDERPHRMARLISPLDDVPQVVTLEQLQAVAAQIVTTAEVPVERPTVQRNGTHDDSRQSAYLQAAIQKEVERVATAAPGERNNCLNEAAYYLGKFVASGALTEAEVRQALTDAAIAVGLDRDPNCGLRGIENTITSGLRGGEKKPRTVPEGEKASRVKVGKRIEVEQKEPEGSPIVRASEIAPKAIQWLWPGRIPIGKLTTFAGIGGLGKSFVLCDMAARVSRGDVWPDGEPGCPPGSTLYLSGEDDPDDTLVPRLIEMGADMRRVCFGSDSFWEVFNLANRAALTTAADAVGGDLRLIAIDPPTSFLAGIDDHKNSELRQLLTPLKAWAAERRVAIVFITHLNKPPAVQVAAQDRVMGSVAWVNAVRAVHVFARDPDDDTGERVIFSPAKMNLARKREGLVYKVVAVNDELGRVEWLGAAQTSADDAVNRNRREANNWPPERVKEWLESLADGLGRIPSRDVKEGIREGDLPRNLVYRVLEKLGYQSQQMGRAWYFVRGQIPPIP